MPTAELVTTSTSDGLRLHGALLHSEERIARPSSPQAVIYLHGAGANFYASAPFDALDGPLLAAGLAVLRANNRGHDTISSAGGGRLPQGAAYETVDDCRHDLEAWRRLLRERGFERIAVVGHSLGALKAVHAAAYESRFQFTSIVAVSPPRLSCKLFLASVQGPTFADSLAEAQSLVANDRPLELMRIRFPIPLLISAASFLDKYGPAERYDLLRAAPAAATPTRYVFGSRELTGSPAFAGTPSALEEMSPPAPHDVRVVEGASHFYAEAEAPLAGLVVEWLTTDHAEAAP